MTVKVYVYCEDMWFVCNIVTEMVITGHILSQRWEVLALTRTGSWFSGVGAAICLPHYLYFRGNYQGIMTTTCQLFDKAGLDPRARVVCGKCPATAGDLTRGLGWSMRNVLPLMGWSMTNILPLLGWSTTNVLSLLETWLEGWRGPWQTSCLCWGGPW